jgi:ribonuclease J
MNRMTVDIINELLEDNRFSRNVMKKQIKRSIANYVKEKTRKEPMIVPILMDI